MLLLGFGNGGWCVAGGRMVIALCFGFGGLVGRRRLVQMHPQFHSATFKFDGLK